MEPTEEFIAAEVPLKETPLQSLQNSIAKRVALTLCYFYKTIFELKQTPRVYSEMSPDESAMVVTFTPQLGIGQSLITPMQLTRSQARISGHHVTFDCFNLGQEEQKLSDIFEDFNWGSIGNLTPDFHYNDGTLHILEFATTMGHDLRSYMNSAQRKMAKYTEAINQFSLRTHRDVTFDVIIVGREGVLSTIDLDAGLCSELIFRFRLSQKIIEKSRNHGIIQATDEELEEDAGARKLLNSFREIKFNFDESGEWSKENYENWISPVSDEEKNSIQEFYIKASRKSQSIVEEELNKRSRVKSELEEECKYKIINYKNETKFNKNVRTDNKPVCIFPLVIPKTRSSYLSFNFKNMQINLKSESGLEQAWASAIHAAQNSSDYLFEENVSDLYKKALLCETSSPEGRSSYKRVHIDLTESEWLELALKGVEGKKHKDDKSVIESMMHSKLGFDLDVSTTDIDEFMCSTHLFQPALDQPGYLVNYEFLIEKANLLAENSRTKFGELANSVLKIFTNTRMFRYCLFISELAAEITMSLRQNCKEHSFIIKTLKYHDVILLIKPTNSAGQIFFSLLIPEDTCEFISDLPFTPFIKQGNVVITNFVSANAQQLSHWATCAANSIVLYSCWLKFYQVDITNLKDITDCPLDMMKMMNLSLLIFLEQKTSTEEILTLLRYVSMECFKSYPGFCDTMKVLNKMPTMYRSRLSCWAFKKLSEEAVRLYGKGYKMVVKKDGNKTRTRWTNVVNPYTGEILSDPSSLVNLFYLGYLRNKHTRSCTNQDLALISKIMKGELSYWEASDRSSLGSCRFKFETKHNPHNYDVGFMKILADEIEAGMVSRLGCYDKNHFMTQYLKALSSQGIDTFMTLKASSSFKPGDEDLTLGHVKDKLKEINRLNKVISTCSEQEQLEELEELKMLTEDDIKHYYKDTARPRVIEEFSEIVTKYQPPALYIRESLDICGKHGLMIDIFKKPQQGGLREIYVITRESRMIQFALELLSRKLCNEFESETMTHPKNKVNLLTNHGVKIRSVSDRLSQNAIETGGKFSVLNSNSSKDKKSWNNTNSPSKFAIVLLRLTPKDLHPLIFNCLKLWDTKNMLLPEGIRNIVLKGKKWEIGDPIMNEFIDSYSTISPKFKSIIHEGKPYITVKTGMMQGILHFTSSLTHTGFNLLMKKSFHKIAANYHWVKDSLFTHLESSDDSAYLKTLFIDSNSGSKILGLRMLYTFDHWSTQVSKLAGFHESFEKTSLHSSRVVEFNSEFCFDNQVHKPDMKFAFACLRIPENESLSETCYQYKCLSSACLESGSNILSTHFIQRAQSLIHYTTLGMTLNPMFHTYSKSLCITTDPGLGFFPLDPCMLSGVVDHQFNVWMLMKGNPVFASKTIKLLETEKLSSFSSGTVLKSAVLQFGDRNRWKRIVNNIESKIGKLDYRQYVQINPRILFMRPEGEQDLIAYHYLKLYTPSIISSLGNVGRMDRMLIRGSYIINFRCLTVGSLWEELIPDLEKTNLLKLSNDLLTMTLDKLTVLESLNLLDESERNLVKLIQSAIKGSESEVPIVMEQNIQLRDSINDKIIPLTQQRALFPQMQEYLSILTCHRTLSQSGHQYWKSTEKKRALVNVYNAPLKDFLSLESMCITKWFGTQYYKIPKSLFIRRWESLQSMYPWLSETFQSSFEKSAFENEISFSNFIKEQSGKNRSLYVTSAPLKIEDGHSLLYSLITRHTWPGILLKARAKDEILNKVSKDVIHPLAIISGLRVTPDYKKTLLSGIIDNNAVYNQCIDEFLDGNATSIRERKLRPILRCIRGDSRAVILDELFNSKLGVVGSWVVTERYDKDSRTYRGMGKWEGRIDNLKVIVHTNNSRIFKIEVNDGLEFRTNFNILKEWMKESYLQFQDNYLVKSSEKDRIVGLIHNNVLHDVLKDSLCTPVYENRSIGITYTDKSLYDMRVNFTSHSIQLKAQMLRTSGKERFGDKNEVTIISSRLYDTDILSDPLPIISTDRIVNLLMNNRCLGDMDPSIKSPRPSSSTSHHSVKFLQPEVEKSQTVKGLFNTLLSKKCTSSDQALSTILSVHKIKLDNITFLDSNEEPYEAVKRLLPSRIFTTSASNQRVDLISAIRQHIVASRNKTSFKVPKVLAEYEIESWNDVLDRLGVLPFDILLLITSVISNRPILVVDYRELEPKIEYHYKGLTLNLNETYLTNCDIFFFQRVEGRVKLTTLVKEAQKFLKESKRLVQVRTEIDPDNYKWPDIFKDLKVVIDVVKASGSLSRNYEPEFHNQLKSWICKSFYNQGKMTLSTVEMITNEVQNVSMEDAGMEETHPSLEEADENIDDFLDFLDGDDGAEMLDNFVHEPEVEEDLIDDNISIASSVDEVPFKDEELEALFTISPALERFGRVKISGTRLFDSLTLKSIKTYDGLFVRPGTLIIKSAVKDILFNSLNILMSGSLSRESYDVDDIPDEM